MEYVIKFFTKAGIEYGYAHTLAQAKALRAERFAKGDCTCGIIGTRQEMNDMEALFAK
jgi:hypothetical protein